MGRIVTDRAVRLRDHWARKTPTERQAHARRTWEGFARKHPGRAALVDRIRAAMADGSLVPGPCDGCGGGARPLYDWERLALVGWRCQACRRPGGPQGPVVAR